MVVMDAETTFLTTFETVLRNHGVTIERREVMEGGTEGELTYVYKLTIGDHHMLFPVSTLTIKDAIQFSRMPSWPEVMARAAIKELTEAQDGS